MADFGGLDRADGVGTFDTVLVANRGEIALRVIRSARDLGLRTAAIYTDLDAEAPHVRAADLAVRVGSYLDIDAVIAAARESGAGAIHPGYGFLSERATFARAVEEAGLKLVGPSSVVMDQMGRKDAARKIAVAAGVPVVPSWGLEDEDLAWPVLVKAAAGGGGKGMRIVRGADEYAAARESAAREAASAFGDDTLLIEKYVESGRHIEVQVLADAHGNVVHLFERDCSTQRRHQKVLEEAPAPTITPAIRDAITRASVALATQVGYENAGTVEFLLDNVTGEVYFLEMNTRLQVEHPVTELVVEVAGVPLDLVALQLRVAAGEPLGFTQDDVRLVGHAIEARIYAEDSYAGFLPQAGLATTVHWPAGVRVDAALESGQVVSTAYDPMLGKVIAHGPDRESARRSLLAALADTAILGLTTNTGFLRVLVGTDDFRDASIDTSWLDRTEIDAPQDAPARAVATWAQVAQLRSALTGVAPGAFAPDHWRHAGADVATYVDGRAAAREVTEHTASIDGFVVREVSHAPGPVDRFEVALEGPHTDAVGGTRHVAFVQVRRGEIEVVDNGQRFVLERPDPFREHGPTAGDGSLLAPMPGTVLAVDVAEGDHVEAGQRLGVIEAMKMELALKAPFDGTVTTLNATVGGQVQLKELLFEVSPVD